MSILSATFAPVKTSRVLFNGCEKIAPRNRVFGKGIAPTRPVKAVGYTAEDAAWFAEQTRDETAPTEEETIGEFLCRTLSPAEYRELRSELDDHFKTAAERDREKVDAESAFNAWADAQAEEVAMMDRLTRGIDAPPDAPVGAPAPAGHVLRADDGTAMAIFLDDANPIHLAACTDRAHKIIRDLGPLPCVAWIARDGGKLALMDRDEFADCLVFCGHVPITAIVIESAFGAKLPRA